MVLEFQNIEKSFGSKKVLEGISFQVEDGKAFGLLGRNGAGKTTSIRILMGVFPADGGQILLDGQPIDHKRVGIGYLPEERGLYPKNTITEQLVYLAQLKGMGRRAAVEAVDYWLKRVGMQEYRNKRLETLSKGNQQKIQLITALAHDPEVVILDEPFSGLDPVNAMLLKDIVKEQIAKGKLVLFSSHQMSYIEEFCDHIAILNKGKLVLKGDLRQIKREYPRDRLVVRTADPEALMAEFGEAATLENDEVLLRLTSPEDKKTVMSRLIARYDIDEVKIFEPSLNDIFVEYTKEA